MVCVRSLCCRTDIYHDGLFVELLWIVMCGLMLARKRACALLPFALCTCRRRLPHHTTHACRHAALRSSAASSQQHFLVHVFCVCVCVVHVMMRAKLSHHPLSSSVFAA